jgi:hypothetical protein
MESYKMAFVNEYVLAEDVKNYELDGLINKYRKLDSGTLPQPGFKYSWTIDRDKNTFLILVHTIEECGPSGRMEPTNRRIFLLVVDGHTVQVEVELLPASSIKFFESPFNIVWKLNSLTPESLPNLSKENICQILRSALECYGYDGARKQIANTLVKLSV